MLVIYMILGQWKKYDGGETGTWLESKKDVKWLEFFEFAGVLSEKVYWNIPSANEVSHHGYKPILEEVRNSPPVQYNGA